VGYTDKAKSRAEQMKGKAKEWVGDKTDNERLQAEGAREQESARMKQGGEQMKQAAQDTTGG
jgi:uncharacterized protein YjbJ (UPF0337 family)